jgi:hypothetical protein
MELVESRVTPYKHQLDGVEALIKLADPGKGRIYPGCFALFDEMGAGKTKQTIDAAQVLYKLDQIDRVIVVAPAAVRDVWFDQELGELAKHLWTTVSGKVFLYHSKNRGWWYGKPDAEKKLQWIITNYEFIRDKNRLAQLLRFAGEKTLLVLDESSSVKNHKAQQTKACLALRKQCGRIILLNGTPIANNPMDMYSQCLMMDQRILGCASYIHFRSRYAIMGGYMQKQIIGWINLEDLQNRIKPYALRRLKSECLDLPPKLPPVTITATLSNETWGMYKSMRDELVAWLDQATVSTAAQAVVKALRLSQMTSGFIGGVEEAYPGSELADMQATRPNWLPGMGTSVPQAPQTNGGQGGSLTPTTVRYISQEKLSVFFHWLEEQLVADKDLKLLVWSRFRAEVRRILHVLETDPKYAHIKIGCIWGGQSKLSRQDSLRLLDPRTAPEGPVIVVGIPASGAQGLNLAAAHTVVDISYDYNLKNYLQAQDRVHRPGQTYPVSYYHIVATGPAGQKTIDHHVVKSRTTKENMATWTTDAWRTALTVE